RTRRGAREPHTVPDPRPPRARVHPPVRRVGPAGPRREPRHHRAVPGTLAARAAPALLAPAPPAADARPPPAGSDSAPPGREAGSPRDPLSAPGWLRRAAPRRLYRGARRRALLRARPWEPPSPPSGATRHRLAVCAIFKDEADYLREWLEF